MADYADITVDAVFPVTVYEYDHFVRGWSSGFQVDKDFEINDQMTNEMVLYEFKPNPNDIVEGVVKKVECGVKFASWDNIPVKAYLFKEKGKYSDMYNGEGKLGEVTVTSNGWYVEQLTFSGLNIENYENLYIGFVDNSNSGEWCSCTYQFNYAKITTRTPSLTITPETGSVELSENHFETYFTIRNDLGIEELAVQFKIGQSPVTGSQQTLDVEDIEGTKRTTTYSTDTIYAWMKTSPNTKYSVSFTVEATDKYGRTAVATIKISLPALTIEAESTSLTFGDQLVISQTDVIKEDNTVTITLTSNSVSGKIKNESYCSYKWFEDTGQLTKKYISITAKATDSFGRNSASLTITATKPDIDAEADENEYQIDTDITITKTDNEAQLDVSVVSGNVVLAGGYKFAPDATTLKIPVSVTWFNKVAGSNGRITNAQIVLTDDLYREQRISIAISGIVNGVNQINPQVTDILSSNVGDSRLDDTSYADKYVKGYSKVSLSAGASSRPGTEIVSLTFSGGGVNGQAMTKDTDTGKYQGTTPNAVTAAQAIFTITATDKFNRAGTKTITVDFVSLLNLTITSIAPSTVTTGSQVTCVVANLVDKTKESTYTLKRGDTQLISDKFTDDHFAIDVDAAWIPDTADETKITLTVTDILGRTASGNFTAKLPVFNVNVPQDPVIMDSDVTFTFEETSGQSVSISLLVGDVVKYTKKNITASSVTVNCPKSWITSGSYVNVTVNATCGKRTDNTKKFALKYPDLVLTVESLTQEVWTIGNYSVANLEDQQVYLDCTYGNKTLYTVGPFAEENFRAMIQNAFDPANVTTTSEIQVNYSVRDAIGRRSALVNVTLIASYYMAPTISNPTVTLIQPPSVKSAFESYVIQGFTRIRLSGTYSENSAAKVERIAVTEVNPGSTTKSGVATLDRTNKTYTYEVQEPFSVALPRFSLVAKDERGMGNTAAIGVFARPYTIPQISVGYHRCDSDGTKNDSGDHCQITLDYNVFPFANQNSATITISTDGYSRALTIPTYSGGNNSDPIYESTYTDIFEADIEKSYEITVSVEDCVTGFLNTYYLSTAGVIMDFRRGGKGVGIGKVAEGDKRVEIHPEWRLMASVQVNGQLQDLSTLLEEILNRLSNGGL